MAPAQNIRRPAKGQRKRIRKQSDAGGDGEGGAGRKDAEARLREDLFGADNAGALIFLAPFLLTHVLSSRV